MNRLKQADDLILRGDILYTPTPTQLMILEKGFLVYQSGEIKGTFQEIPSEYTHLPIKDYGDCLILPGLVDLHLHAPQYPFRGLGMDMELLPWLETYAFVEEAKYSDETYAQTAYSHFVKDLIQSPTTRSVIFATIHLPATYLLMDELEKSGLYAFVGKVNMDRNAPAILCETTDESLATTEQWLMISEKKYTHVKPILTPRFVPSCTDDLLAGLGVLAQKTLLPIQSHLCENISEIAWVRTLHPEQHSYTHTYHAYQLLGNPTPTIMAHCVHLTEEEILLLKNNGVYVAHCPQSNTNLSSGIAPIRHLLQQGIRIGLGSDIAGGSSLSLFRAMCEAIQVSKLYQVLIDQQMPPLTISEVFYMATKGGGSFFGKVGSFEAGYALDAIILDDAHLRHQEKLTLNQRLERLIYLADDRSLVGKYVDGYPIL